MRRCAPQSSKFSFLPSCWKLTLFKPCYWKKSTSKIHVFLKNNKCRITNNKSVDAAASKGARFNFKNNNSKMVLPDGTTCEMKVKDKLYYLDSVTEKDVSSEDSCNVSFDLKAWHEIMGHYNYSDIVIVWSLKQL